MVYLVKVLNDSMPHTSDNLSKFGTLLWLFILLSGLIILTNIFIITIVHRKCPKWLPTVVFEIKHCLISCYKGCLSLYNLNKENKKVIEKTNTNLQDESTEASSLLSTGDGIELQQTGTNTDQQDPENESSKNTGAYVNK